MEGFGMAGDLKQMELVADPKDGQPGETLYEFRSRKRYVDQINELTNSEHLSAIAKALVDALDAASGLREPITILVDGKYDDFDTKLLDWLGLLPNDAVEKLVNLFKRAERHSEEHGRVGIVFGLCFDPSLEGVQVSIPNVFQTGLIPVVITSGPGLLRLAQ
jgi:hypothetical protein